MSNKVTTMDLKDDGVIKSIGAERKVIVYSKNACPNCEHVKWALKAQDVPHEIRMIEMPVQMDATEAETLLMESEVMENRRQFMDYGYMQAPVTVFPNGKVLPGFEMGDFVDQLRLMGYDF